MHTTEVFVVTGQLPDIRQITVNFLKVARILCLLQSVQTRVGVHPSSYAIGIWVDFPGDVDIKLTIRF